MMHKKVKVWVSIRVYIKVRARVEEAANAMHLCSICAVGGRVCEIL